MSDIWIPVFLQQLAATGIVASACRAAGVPRSTVTLRLRNDPDFKASYDEAMQDAVDQAEAEVWRRGVHGFEEPVIHQGEPTLLYERNPDGSVAMEAYNDHYVGKDEQVHVRVLYRPKLLLDENGRPQMLKVRKYSDALLGLLVKGRRKEVFSERTEVTGADGAPLQGVDDTTRAARIAAIMAAAEQRAAGAGKQPDYGDVI